MDMLSEQLHCWIGQNVCSLCCHILSCFVSHRLFHEHIQRLSKVVTANHKALQVPEVSSWWHYFSCIYVEGWNLLVHVVSKSVGHCLSFSTSSGCRFTWRRPPGPLHSLKSGPSMRTRRHVTKSSVYCACVPPSWTSSVWPMKTPSLEQMTLSLCLSLSSLG